MTPPTFLYVRFYVYGNNKISTYVGITDNMERRQKEHDEGKCRTTNKMNKSYGLAKYIFYREILISLYEKTFKKYSNNKKLHIINKDIDYNDTFNFALRWKRWAG